MENPYIMIIIHLAGNYCRTKAENIRTLLQYMNKVKIQYFLKELNAGFKKELPVRRKKEISLKGKTIITGEIFLSQKQFSYHRNNFPMTGTNFTVILLTALLRKMYPQNLPNGKKSKFVCLQLPLYHRK